MSNTTDSTRTLKTAATACRWIGLAMLAATIIMAIAHVTSFIALPPCHRDRAWGDRRRCVGALADTGG